MRQSTCFLGNDFVLSCRCHSRPSSFPKIFPKIKNPLASFGASERVLLSIATYLGAILGKHPHAGSLPPQQAQQHARQQQQVRLIMTGMLAKTFLQVKWFHEKLKLGEKAGANVGVSSDSCTLLSGESWGDPSLVMCFSTGERSGEIPRSCYSLGMTMLIASSLCWKLLLESEVGHACN